MIEPCSKSTDWYCLDCPVDFALAVSVQYSAREATMVKQRDLCLSDVQQRLQTSLAQCHSPNRAHFHSIRPRPHWLPHLLQHDAPGQ